MGAALRCCLPVYRHYVSQVVVPALMMGKWAWRALVTLDGAKLPKGGLSKGRGFLRDSPYLHNKYIATWHPTYALSRNPYEWGAFRVDLARMARLLTGKLRPGPQRLVTEPTLEDLRTVAYDRFVALDIETKPRSPRESWTGKDPRRARLDLIGLGNSEWGLSFDPAERPDLLAPLRRLLAEKVAITHNGITFDRPALDRAGIYIKRIVDTLHMRKALVATSPASLAYCSSLYDDPHPWKEMGLEDPSEPPSEQEWDEEDGGEDEEEFRGTEDDDKGLLYYARDPQAKRRYNAEDCVRTARIHVAMEAEPEWQSEQVQRLYQFRCNSAMLAADMHEIGRMVDPEQRVALRSELEGLIVTRQKKLVEMAGIPSFTGSPNQMRSLLFKRHERGVFHKFGLLLPTEKVGYTKTGLCAVNQDALLLLLVNPLISDEAKALISQYWKVAAPKKAKSTFVDSALIDQAIGDDGRLRPEMGSMRTDTGRWTEAKPSTVTLPKEKE